MTLAQRKLGLREVLACLDAGESAAALFDPSTVELTAEPISVDATNLLVDADGAHTMSSLGAALGADELFSPLLLLPESTRLLDVAARYAGLFDKCVHDAEFASLEGVRGSTPRAPRSAAGPDALGLLMLEAPPVFLLRARLGVMRRAALKRRLVEEDVGAAFVRVMADAHDAMAIVRDGALSVWGAEGDEAPMPSALVGTWSMAVRAPLAPLPDTGSGVTLGLPREGRVVHFRPSAPAAAVTYADAPDAGARLVDALLARGAAT